MTTLFPLDTLQRKRDIENNAAMPLMPTILSMADSELISLYLLGVMNDNAHIELIENELEHCNNSLNIFFNEKIHSLFPEFFEGNFESDIRNVAFDQLARRRALEIGDNPSNKLIAGTSIYSISDIHHYLHQRFLQRHSEFGLIGFGKDNTVIRHKAMNLEFSDLYMYRFIKATGKYCVNSEFNKVVVYANRAPTSLCDLTVCETMFKHKLSIELGSLNVELFDLVFITGHKLVSHVYDDCPWTVFH